jgi:hypothetical protein
MWYSVFPLEIWASLVVLKERALRTAVSCLLPSNPNEAGKQGLPLTDVSACSKFKTCHTPAMQVAK